ncbi:ABC transporter permease (plasmid) [Tunturibacter empetritectus]|uniref:ABC transporter permease n=1 Tax=Tunturiibacter empetritectus TaxID=3069691 RepID=A0AAU7ZJN1_9BACT
MNWIPQIFRRRKIYNDLSEEIRLHMEERTEQLMLEGMSPKEAKQAAHLAFGNRTVVEERSREVWQWPTLESIVADVRFALRQLRKSPGFTIAAVLTLALAIGANAVVFGIMDGLVLRPLNVLQVESLYGTHYGDNPTWQSYPNYIDLRNRNHSFEDLSAFNMVLGVGFDTGKDPIAANGFAATGNYFDVLRIQPYLGRLFHASDEHGPNSAPYIVLTYAYWHDRFHDDPGVVGRSVQLDKHPFTIIGVAPPKFQGTIMFIAPDFFMPLVNEEQMGAPSLNTRATEHGVFEAMGHLKPRVTPAQAVADVDVVNAYLEKTYPRDIVHHDTALSREGLTSFGPAVRAFVTGLMLLSGLILLAACANLGSLFAARAADRSREIALRLALGSTRKRILRGLFTEALLISLAGGAAGLLGSFLLLRRMSIWQPIPAVPLHIPVHPDAMLYVVALGLALLSGFLFGIVPIRQILRANPYEIIKAGSSARTGRRLTIRDVLLVAQIAICAVLVTSSLVAVRGLVRSLHSKFGFDPRDTMTAGVDLAAAGYSLDKVPAMQKRMIEAMGTIPKVEAVGLVNGYPPLVYTAGNRVDVYKEETTDLRPPNAAAMPFRYEVSPGYFEAASTNLLVGRSFSWQDDKNAPAVAVVNRDFANRMFGSVTAAVGRTYRLQDGARVQVVGVVEDGKYMSLTEDQQPAMFLPFMQSPSSAAYLLVRSKRDPQQLATAMRLKVRELDSGLPVSTQTLSQMLEVVLFPARVATMALGVLGMMGAMLSITGIFGMAAYSVSKRLRELGIRMALGAARKEVLHVALGRPFKLLAIGSAAGLALGLLATRVLAFIVYQATPRDPFVLAGVVVAMALLGLVATWIPAQRALSVNPLILLRED